MERKKSNIEDLAHLYFYVKDYVIENGYYDEIEWQQEVCIDCVTESMFLRECAWVILSSGMQESTISKVFPNISEAFLNWKSAGAIISNRRNCFNRAINYFGHCNKLKAILYTANQINTIGFDTFFLKVKNDNNIAFLQTLPYLGPATSYHLAKNLGIDTAKPDRHLIRIAGAMSFDCPLTMCKSLSQLIEEKVSVIDIVLWRFASINKQYISTFSHY